MINPTLTNTSSVFSKQFLSSLILGQAGRYKIRDLTINFHKTPIPRETKIEKIFMTQYFHTFIHESGHAIADRLFSKKPTKITIYDNGLGTFAKKEMESNKLKSSIIYAAGPLTHIAFCFAKIILGCALLRQAVIEKRTNHCNIAMIYALCSVIMKGQGIFHLIKELAYTRYSIIQQDDGDFGLIAKNGPFYLGAAVAALVGECVLGCYLAERVILPSFS